VSPVRTPSEGVLVAAQSAVALLDLDPFEAERAGVELPCRVQDPELWFAETPADLELAKSHCPTARSAGRASPARSSGTSRGACGVARSSSAAW
jgi:hypothetical protein